MKKETTNTRLVSVETATLFAPYLSALKDGVLRHRADKQSVLVLLDKIESLLTECEKAILEQWKIKNLNYST